MNEIISKTIVIKCDKLPPCVDFIENKIKEFKIEPLRWSIVDIKNNELTLNVNGYIL